MATVNTIDVALRSNTEHFEAGLARGSSAVVKFASDVGATTTSLSKSSTFQVDTSGFENSVSKASGALWKFSSDADRIAVQLGKVATLFQQGALTPKEYSDAIKALSRDLDANVAGFGNMKQAVARADSILRGLENNTERYQNSLRELNQLFKLGAMGPEQYKESVKRLTTAYEASLPVMRNAAVELRAQSAGFTSMSQAVSRADAIIRAHETTQERYNHSVRELHQLRKAGALDEQQFARALSSLNPAAYGAATAMKSLGVQAGMIGRMNLGGFNGQLQTLARATGALGTAVPHVGALTSNLSSLASLGGPIAAVAGSIAGVALALRNAMSETTRVSDISLELGIDPQELLGLEHAAKQTGVQISTLQAGLQRLTVHGAEAAAGSTKMLDVFDRLHIDAKKFNEASPDIKFRAVAEAMEKIQNPAEKARIAVQLFGSEGISLLSTLKLGAAGLDEAREKTILFGNSITKDGLSAVGSWQKSVAQLKLAWNGFSQNLLDTVSPAVEFVSAGMSKATTAFVFLKKAMTGDTFGASIVAGWEKAVPTFDELQAKAKALNTTASLQITANVSPAQRQIEQWQKQRREFELKAKVNVEEIDTFKIVMDDLKSTLAQVEQSLQRALSPQEKFLELANKINHAYDLSLITLEKRNQLLQGAQFQMIEKPIQDDRQKKINDIQAQLKQAAAAITDSVKSPLESFTDKVAELQKLRKLGLITPETFGRAFQQAKDQFAKTMEFDNPFAREERKVAAIEGGTQDAFKAFHQAKDDAKKADELVAEQKKTNQKLDQIARRALVLAAAKW